AGAGDLSALNVTTAGSGNITLRATNAAGGAITQVGTAMGNAINITALTNVSVDDVRGTSVNLTSQQGAITSIDNHPVQASAQLTLSARTGITLKTLAQDLEAVNSTT